MSVGVTPARRAALEALRATRRGDLGDRALERAAAHLPPREHGWVQELVYGTLRLRGRLDHLLAQRARGGLEALQPDVLDVLRLGLYQLLEMGSVPPYAAISQSVELVREAGSPRAAGLVNAVLNGLQRERERLSFPDAEREPVEHLATWGSHPRWLLERWVDRWGLEGTRRLVEANNTRPDLYLRLIEIPAAEAIERLAAAGIEAEAVPFSPDSIRVLPPAGAREALAVVPAVVQDPAAALVVRFACPPDGARVLDLCAAPGGKALGLAGDGAQVTASDISERKLERVRENVERLGLGERVTIVQADARRPPFEPADLVLLDAPCTGTGTLRRHPDGRWRIEPEHLRQLPALQGELLSAAAPLVRAGGLLVYATCSLEPEENEAQVREFLAGHPEFVSEPPDACGVEREMIDTDGFLHVLPQHFGVDGSFAARLRKSA